MVVVCGVNCGRVKMWVCECVGVLGVWVCVRYVCLGCVRGGVFLGELQKHSLKGESTAGSRRPAPGMPTAFLAQHGLQQYLGECTWPRSPRRSEENNILCGTLTGRGKGYKFHDHRSVPVGA